jgi:hypothetical protein
MILIPIPNAVWRYACKSKGMEGANMMNRAEQNWPTDETYEVIENDEVFDGHLIDDLLTLVDGAIARENARVPEATLFGEYSLRAKRIRGEQLRTAVAGLDGAK